MFDIRSIVYFDSFVFKNGSKPKPKYFLVIHSDNENIVLAVLPTSKDFVPSEFELQDGCINNKTESYNCFKIKGNTPITDCLKVFKVDTFLYSSYLDTYEVSYLEEKNKKYELFGMMKLVVFEQILICFKNSPTTKNKYKKLL